MTRKMLKEEKELREFIGSVIDTRLFGEERRRSSRLITALVRAVRADAAKVACGKNDACGKCAEEIATLIRARR